MRRIDSSGSPGLTKSRLVILYRTAGSPSRSRSGMLAIENGESPPNLDDALEAAMNAILRLANQRKESYGRG